MTTKRKRKYSIDPEGESVTQQQFKDSCNINNIIALYRQTGIDPQAGKLVNQKFGFATSKDFAESAFAVAEINSAFAAQPSSIRSEFRNDASAWLDSVGTPEPADDEIVPPEVSQETPETAPEMPNEGAN